MSSAAKQYSPFVRWPQIIAFFVYEDFGSRYKRSSLSALFTMFEPVALISVIFIARWLQTGFLNWDDAVFHTTGILPFYLFMHISQRMRGVDLLPPVPNVTWFDRATAVVLAEVLGKTIVGVLMFSALHWIGAKHALPQNARGLIAPCVLLSMFGLGVGLFNSTLAIWFPSWLYIYAIAMRVLMLASGLVIRADMIPPSGRYLTYINPLFHGVTWFRSEFYFSYPSFMLDKTYFVESTFFVLIIGAGLHAITKAYR